MKVFLSLSQLKQLESSDSWLVHLQQAYSKLSVLDEDSQSVSGRVTAVMITSDREDLTSGVKTPESGRNILASPQRIGRALSQLQSRMVVQSLLLIKVNG